MELRLVRNTFSSQSTIGDLYINDVRECFILEDYDRGLKQIDTLEIINKVKVFGETCIPYGRYEVVITFSNRFSCMMPLLVSVPGWEGVRIHWGNYAKNTEGCLIVGTSKDKDFVGHSKDEYAPLLAKLRDAASREKIFITITK